VKTVIVSPIFEVKRNVTNVAGAINQPFNSLEVDMKTQIFFDLTPYRKLEKWYKIAWNLVET
jgi:hypothetical protein